MVRAHLCNTMFGVGLLLLGQIMLLLTRSAAWQRRLHRCHRAELRMHHWQQQRLAAVAVVVAAAALVIRQRPSVLVQ